MNNPDITYKISSLDLKSAMSDMLTTIIKESVLAPYLFRSVNLTTACDILGISKPTIYRYIKDRKLIPLENAGNYKCYRFS